MTECDPKRFFHISTEEFERNLKSYQMQAASPFLCREEENTIKYYERLFKDDLSKTQLWIERYARLGVPLDPGQVEFVIKRITEYWTERIDNENKKCQKKKDSLKHIIEWTQEILDCRKRFEKPRKKNTLNLNWSKNLEKNNISVFVSQDRGFI